jgi:hypothetical protein
MIVLGQLSPLGLNCLNCLNLVASFRVHSMHPQCSDD